jgi:Fe2+/Zn2+ uptake regulation proteins
MEKATRNTRQRAVILNALRSVCTHPTADEIFTMTRKSLPHISLGTVYRNLDLLIHQKEILCLENCNSQKRFDGNLLPHHHIRCSKCGRISDVMTPLAMPDLGKISVEGFSLTGVNILFEGVCDACGNE